MMRQWSASDVVSPPMPAELRQLIATMATANRTSGEERIATKRRDAKRYLDPIR
jgi:hypothetical protein